MIIQLPITAFLNENYGQMLMNYKDSLYFEGVIPDRLKGKKDYTQFQLDQLNQGELPFMLAIDGSILEKYKFYSELSVDKLDDPVPASFPNCWKDEEHTILKTLREYHCQFVKIKDDKCLLRIGEGFGNGVYSSKTSFSDEILKAWVTEYDDTCSNIYTSEEAIAGKIAEYEQEIVSK